MNTQSILVVQTFSLVLGIGSIALFIYIGRKQPDYWGLITGPLLFIVILTLFLAERVIVKTTGWPVLSGKFINSWSILIQLSAVFICFSILVSVVLFRRLNGDH